MNIGMFNPELVYPRGAEKQFCHLAYELKQMGHNVTIYTFELSETFEFKSLLNGIEIISLNTQWKTNIGKLNYIRWINLCYRMSRKLKKHDILNVHNFPASWIAGFTNIPIVWTCNEPPAYLSKSALMPIFKMIDQMKCRKIKCVIALDNKMKEIIEKQYAIYDTFSNDKYCFPIIVLGSAAELNHDILHIDNNKIDILTVAALYPQKRVSDLILATEDIECTVHIVGDGELKNAMIDYCRNTARNRKGNVEFYGDVSDTALYKLYTIADIAVYTPQKQPWGIFPLEAILAGIPTIVSDETGVLDIIDNICVKYKTGNIYSLNNAIKYTITNIDDMRSDTLINAEFIKKNLTWKRLAEKYIIIFDGILDNRFDR